MKSLVNLTPEMLQELDEFLLSDQAPDDCMQISDLDGFLTGIVVGPELIMPSEWMPIIWQEESPDFKDLEQAERILGTIMGRYNEIIRSLDDNPTSFAPILLEARDGTQLADDWAAGFMDALGLCPDAWDLLFDDPNNRFLIGPILALVHDKDGEPFVDGTLDELKEMRAEAAEILPHVVKGIYDFWKVRRTPDDSHKRPSARKLGRNELCPCGSGRKYKRCCGAN